MTQPPPPWGPQGGYPQQPPQPGGGQPPYPPQGYGQPGYGPPPGQQPPPGPAPRPGQQPAPGPQPYPGQAFPPAPPRPGQQPPPGYYPPAGSPGGPYGGQFAPPPGQYQNQPGSYPPGGYPNQPGARPGGTPKRKSPVTLILIVVAAVVLLAAVGGIFMVLSKHNGNQPAVTITPGQPSAPPDQPSPNPSGGPSKGSTPTPTDGPNQPDPPTGDAIDLGNGIQLVPASGWQVGKTSSGVAQLSRGDDLFIGQAISATPDTNPGQLCTAWHKQVADGSSGGKFQDPKKADLGTTKVNGATCLAQVTVSNGQGSATIDLYSLVSVRKSDGVTVIGTIAFADGAGSEQLNSDFVSMMNSMLESQT